MKQDLRDLEVGMISHQAHLHRLFSQKNSISPELSELPKSEELLQNQTQEAAGFRQRAEDGWIHFILKTTHLGFFLLLFFFYFLF